MKNYYEILEVDKHASNEIIKNAYKTLVKKYHPDLKEGEEKLEAEEKIKQVNEAYNILSDKIKRTEYDNNLTENSISIEQYNLIVYENSQLKKELNNIKHIMSTSENTSYTRPRYTNMHYTQNQNVNNQNVNNYNDFLYSAKELVKKLIGILLSFIIVGIVIFIILHLPFLKDFFINGNLIVLFVIIIAFYYMFWKNK